MQGFFNRQYMGEITPKNKGFTWVPMVVVECYPPWNFHFRTWKWMVGIRSFPFCDGPFSGANCHVSFREGICARSSGWYVSKETDVKLRLAHACGSQWDMFFSLASIGKMGEKSGGDQQSSKQKVEVENCLKLVGGLSQKQGIRAGVQTPIISI